MTSWVAEAEAGAAGEDGGEHRHAVEVDAGRRAPRRRERGDVGKGLHFAEEGPAALHSHGYGGAGGGGIALADEERRGVGDLCETGAAHLEQRDVVGGAEAVLGAAEEAQAADGLALHREHNVDHVLERPWAGDGAVLGDVAGHKRGRSRRLGPAEQELGALSHLRQAARSGGDVGRRERLYGVDDEHGGPHVFEQSADGRGVGLGGEEDAGVMDAEALAAEAHLRAGLFAGDVEDGPVARGDKAGDLQEESRLPDAGVAGEEEDGAGDDASAEEAVELAEAG